MFIKTENGYVNVDKIATIERENGRDIDNNYATWEIHAYTNGQDFRLFRTKAGNFEEWEKYTIWLYNELNMNYIVKAYEEADK